MLGQLVPPSDNIYKPPTRGPVKDNLEVKMENDTSESDNPPLSKITISYPLPISAVSSPAFPSSSVLAIFSSPLGSPGGPSRIWRLLLKAGPPLPTFQSFSSPALSTSALLSWPASQPRRAWPILHPSSARCVRNTACHIKVRRFCLFVCTKLCKTQIFLQNTEKKSLTCFIKVSVRILSLISSYFLSTSFMTSVLSGFLIVERISAFS